MYKNIINEAFKLILTRKYELIKVMLIPLAIFEILDYFFYIKGGNNLFIYIIYGILSFLISIFLAINLYQILLLDKNSTPPYGAYKFDNRYLRFALNALAFWALICFNGLIFFISSEFLADLIHYFHIQRSYKIFILIIFCIPFIYLSIIILSRLSLVLPSIAIDKNMNIIEAYRITKKYKLLTFLMIILIPSLMSAIISFVYNLSIEYLMVIISPKLVILKSFIKILSSIIIMSFLATTYKYIMNEIKVQD